MTDIDYIGPFKEHIKNHIALKRAIGYNYDTEAQHLARFDQFTLTKYPGADCLTKEIVLDWCSKKSFEAQANQCSRVSILRQFSLYLDSIHIQSYIVPKGYYPAERRYLPHIYTHEELTKLFAQTEQCCFSGESPYRHLVMPVLFRMIYMCGLRLSEARLLKVGDVDLDNGVLSIHQAKKDNSRLVPMSDWLRSRCCAFSAQVHSHSAEKDYYFPALDGKPMTRGNVYHNFRRFLWRAGISHGGRGKGPRIHDLRHTYAVHCLKKWTEQNKDLAVFLPVLRTYMGHDSFDETAYYLRLTADVFPDITLRMETSYPGMIPKSEGAGNETN